MEVCVDAAPVLGDWANEQTPKECPAWCHQQGGQQHARGLQQQQGRWAGHWLVPPLVLPGVVVGGGGRGMAHGSHARATSGAVVGSPTMGACQAGQQAGATRAAVQGALVVSVYSDEWWGARGLLGGLATGASWDGGHGSSACGVELLG